MEPDFEIRAGELIEAGRFIHGRGWVPATSGNFSARLGNGQLLITVSGAHKGRLRAEDLMIIDADGSPLDDRRPSAETALHTALYRRFPEIGAVLHPHSPASVLISRLCDGALILEDYELLKAFPGIDTHAVRVQIPIFPNDQVIDRLAAAVDRYLQEAPDCVGYIIEGHGFYTWGRTVDDALRHVEALEFLFALETKLRGIKS